MKVICKFNNPMDIPKDIPDNFDYGLEIDKEYIVMGLLNYKESEDCYILTDTEGNPSWFPIQLFEISSNKILSNFHYRVNLDREDIDYRNLIGFSELCNDIEYFNKLLLRDELALEIYFKRKKEAEKILEALD